MEPRLRSKEPAGKIRNGRNLFLLFIMIIFTMAFFALFFASCDDNTAPAKDFRTVKVNVVTENKLPLSDDMSQDKVSLENQIALQVWGYVPPDRKDDDWQTQLFEDIKADISSGLEKRNPDLTDMVLIPAGKVPLGFEKQGALVKKDIHSFYIDKFETTIDRYNKCVDEKQCLPIIDNVCHNEKSPGNLPAALTFKQAERYCLWRGARLPNPDEWEKAARGEDGRIYPWGNSPPTDKHANICGVNCNFEWSDKNWDDGFACKNPVDIFHEGDSPYGINQMSGNVKEWVQTPEGFAENTFYARGSSWYSTANELLATNDHFWILQTRLDDKGARCVIVVDEIDEKSNAQKKASQSSPDSSSDSHSEAATPSATSSPSGVGI